MKSRFKILTVQNLRTVVYGLISRSCWFEVEPLPNDEYCVSVKDEQELFMKTVCSMLPDNKLKVQVVYDSLDGDNCRS